MWNEIARGLWPFKEKKTYKDHSQFMSIPLSEFTEKEKRWINTYRFHGEGNFQHTFEFLCSIPEMYGTYDIREIKEFYASIPERKRNYDKRERSWKR